MGTKITDLNGGVQLAVASLAAGDLIPIVDASDTTESPEGTTKPFDLGAFSATKADETQSYAWASRPGSATTGEVALMTDIGPTGGTYMQWDGTYWKVMAPTAIIFDITTQDAGSLSTSELVVKQGTIPAGLLRAGRFADIEVICGRNGTTDALTTPRIRIGSAGTTSDALALTMLGVSGSGRQGVGTIRFSPTSSTNLREISHPTLGYGYIPVSASNTVYPVDLTVANIDSTALIVSGTCQMAGTTNLGQWHVMIVTLHP